MLIVSGHRHTHDHSALIFQGPPILCLNVCEAFSYLLSALSIVPVTAAVEIVQAIRRRIIFATYFLRSANICSPLRPRPFGRRPRPILATRQTTPCPRAMPSIQRLRRAHKQGDDGSK